MKNVSLTHMCHDTFVCSRVDFKTFSGGFHCATAPSFAASDLLRLSPQIFRLFDLDGNGTISKEEMLILGKVPGRDPLRPGEMRSNRHHNNAGCRCDASRLYQKRAAPVAHPPPNGMPKRMPSEYTDLAQGVGEFSFFSCCKAVACLFAPQQFHEPVSAPTDLLTFISAHFFLRQAHRKN